VSHLRPITVLAGMGADGFQPCGKAPELKFLPLEVLRIDAAYQRPVTPQGLRNIRNIVQHFDWAKFAPLIVARAGEHYAIIDGQHRAIAAATRGFNAVPCMIVVANAQSQASIFAAVNGNVTPMTALSLYKAGLAAQDAWALDLKRAADIGGIVLLHYPKAKSEIKPFESIAIGTLRQLIRHHGVERTGWCLKRLGAGQGADQPGYWSAGLLKKWWPVFCADAFKDAVVDNMVALHDLRFTEPRQLLESWMTRRGMGDLPAQIRDLSKRGFSSAAIAARLRVTYAEVERALKGGAA
jgi:hypothetical protein